MDTEILSEIFSSAEAICAAEEPAIDLDRIEVPAELVWIWSRFRSARIGTARLISHKDSLEWRAASRPGSAVAATRALPVFGLDSDLVCVSTTSALPNFAFGVPHDGPPFPMARSPAALFETWLCTGDLAQVFESAQESRLAPCCWSLRDSERSWVRQVAEDAGEGWSDDACALAAALLGVDDVNLAERLATAGPAAVRADMRSLLRRMGSEGINALRRLDAADLVVIRSLQAVAKRLDLTVVHTPGAAAFEVRDRAGNRVGFVVDWWRSRVASTGWENEFAQRTVRGLAEVRARRRELEIEDELLDKLPPRPGVLSTALELLKRRFRPDES